jgi:hypothetical protein
MNQYMYVRVVGPPHANSHQCHRAGLTRRLARRASSLAKTSPRETLNANQAVPRPGDVDTRRPFYVLYGLEQGLYQYRNCDNSNYNDLQTKLQQH